jgi:hypothetical protein
MNIAELERLYGEDMITGRQVADMFAMHPKSVQNWRKGERSFGPTFVYDRGVAKYKIRDIMIWVVEVNTYYGRYLLTDVSNWLEKREANKITA